MKTKFIKNILFQNAYQAAVITRNKNFPIFKIKDNKQTTNTFKLIAEILFIENVESFKNNIKNLDHFKEIKTIKEKLENEFSSILKNKRMRFGITQKMVNLYFIFLWCIGEIETPLHCPIDGIVKSKLMALNKDLILPNWTEMEMDGYNLYLNAFKKLDIDNIAIWELEKWN